MSCLDGTTEALLPTRSFDNVAEMRILCCVDESAIKHVLAGLRAESEQHRARIDDLNAQLKSEDAAWARVDDAIRVLENLLNPEVVEAPSERSTESEAYRPSSTSLGVQSEDALFGGETASDRPSVSSVLRQYLPKTPGGKRLKSSKMVADVLADIGEPITRSEFRTEFYKKFDEDEIKDYWDRPDNALATALARAAKENMIQAIGDDKFAPNTYKNDDTNDSGMAPPNTHENDGDTNDSGGDSHQPGNRIREGVG